MKKKKTSWWEAMNTPVWTPIGATGLISWAMQLSYLSGRYKLVLLGFVVFAVINWSVKTTLTPPELGE